MWGEPVVGSFSTPPAIASNIRFLWSGDTAGQGWGINEEWGGMRIYETMRQTKPDFFIHCGDTIYADGPIQAEVKLDNGDVWKNVVTPEKSKVAETLQEFRGNFAYNLMDKNVRAFNQEVPMIVQWDDHETVNNWYPAEVLNDPRYQNEQSVALLSARARRAFFEMNPIRSSATDPQRIYENSITAHCWMCLPSTCAATVVITVPTTRPRHRLRQRSLAASRFFGSSSNCWPPKPPGR